MSNESESKSEFARRCRVDPSQVTRWIAAGIIGADAIEGVGRGARILVHRAVPQVDRRRDPGQALGNGAKTMLDATPAQKPAKAIARPVPSGPAIELPDDAALDPDAEDYNAQKTRLAKAQADAQEMKNALARRDAAPIVVMEARLARHIAATRAHILAVSGRLRSDIPVLTESHIKIIDRELRAALNELGKAAHVE